MNLRLEQVSAVNPDGSVRLHPLSLSFQGGQVAVVIGQAGAGKSTLLDLAAGLDRPTAGNVFLDDQTLWQGPKRNRPNRQLTRSFGLVFQHAEEQLFARSVFGEFDYALRGLGLDRSTIAARAEQALLSVGLEPSLLQMSPLRLSGGQKRRVAFATTLATEPEWWFLDEPTAGLDPQAIEAFAWWLRRHNQRLSGGVIVATHDLDTFLPLADQVIILADGMLVGSYPVAELLEDWSPLAAAGIGLPSALALADRLSQAGLSIRVQGLSADAAADGIANALLQRKVPQQPVTPPTVGPPAKAPASRAPSPDRAVSSSRLAFVRGLDPRAKWLAYVLISAGFIIDSRWPGIVCSFAMAIGLVTVSGVPWRQIWSLIRPFLWFILITASFSGIRLSLAHGLQVGFGFTMVWVTLQHVLPFLFVMAVGILLPATTSQLSLKQGLEQGLAGLKHLRLPVEGFALGTSLMLRFVPLISAEMTRFTRIARARGQALRPNGRLSARAWVTMAIPLLLSLLSLADALSTAMEARGYRQIGQRRTSSTVLRMQKADALVVLGGICLFGISMVVQYL